jgi:hypothetical protein
MNSYNIADNRKIIMAELQKLLRKDMKRPPYTASILILIEGTRTNMISQMAIDS